MRQRGFDTPRFHYDWWLFPLPFGEEIAGSSTSRRYALTAEQTEELLGTPEFMDCYLHCLRLYLTAQLLPGWNGYIIRFEKVLWSLRHFLRAAHNAPNRANQRDIHQLWKCSLVAQSIIAKENLLRSTGTRCDSFRMFQLFWDEEVHSMLREVTATPQSQMVFEAGETFRGRPNCVADHQSCSRFEAAAREALLLLS